MSDRTKTAIARLAVESAWSRRELELWVEWGFDQAKRDGIDVSDEEMALLLDVAVQVSTTVPEHLRPSSWHFIKALEANRKQFGDPEGPSDDVAG